MPILRRHSLWTAPYVSAKIWRGESISSLLLVSNGPAERERIRQEEAWFCSLVLVICNNHNFTRRRLVSKCTTILNCVIANEEASSVLAITDLFSWY